jgi:hypothetical protein
LLAHLSTKEWAGKQANNVTSTKYVILNGEHIGHVKIGADNMDVGEGSTGDLQWAVQQIIVSKILLLK